MFEFDDHVQIITKLRYGVLGRVVSIDQFDIIWVFTPGVTDLCGAPYYEHELRKV